MPTITALHFSNLVLDEIRKQIADHEPERGGAMLGPIGKPIITHLLLDEQALTSGASYLPSQELTKRVQQLELSAELEFKGVIHSHPGGLDCPSGPDEAAMEEGLKLNPHMSYFIAPIVTMQRPWGRLKHHELPLSQGKISCYAAYRRERGGVRVEPLSSVREVSERELTQLEQTLEPGEQSLPTKLLPLKPDLERICQTFGSSAPPEIFVTEIEGKAIPVGRVILKGGLELLLLFSESYPVAPPLLLITPEGEDTEEVQIPWSLQTSANERLLTALNSLILGEGPYRKVYGPLGKPPLTAQSERARLASWSGYYSGSDPKTAATEVQQGLFARSQGLLSEQISSQRVLVAGTGSVGSYLAEQLVRSGVGQFTLIDPDTVEVAHLCRTSYDLTDLGRSKVEALARRLVNINPLVELTLQTKSLSDFELEEFDALVQQADLVVAATDDPKAQRILNHFAYGRGKPALFVGLYEGAKGGEVIICIPEKTPCYLCATSKRHAFEQGMGQVSANLDYGTGRLMGEVALAADIHHATSVAVKMALSLLLPEDAEATLKGFVKKAIASGFSYLTLSMVPEYWFYPTLFGETPGQYAYQSVWLTPERRQECPVCGEVHHRVNPRLVPLRTPQADGIRAALSQKSSAAQR